MAGRGRSDEAPAWVREHAERCAVVEQAIDSRDYEGEAHVLLDEARSLLARGDLDAARQWLDEADAEHRKAHQGAELERSRARARDQGAQLLALGRAAPAEHADVHAWVLSVGDAWSAAAAALRRDLDAVAFEVAVLGPQVAVDRPLDEAREQVQRGQLPVAAASLARAREALAAALARDNVRLGAELAALRASVIPWPPRERAPLLVAIERAAARRTAGLDQAADVADLGALVAALQARRPPAAVCIEEPGSRPVRVAWVHGGVEAHGDEDRTFVARLRGVRVAGVGPDDAVTRVSGWGELIGARGLPLTRSVWGVAPGDELCTVGPRMLSPDWPIERLRGGCACIAPGRTEALGRALDALLAGPIPSR